VATAAGFGVGRLADSRRPADSRRLARTAEPGPPAVPCCGWNKAVFSSRRLAM
jgi:hypothetical protein